MVKESLDDLIDYIKKSRTKQKKRIRKKKPVKFMTKRKCWVRRQYPEHVKQGIVKTYFKRKWLGPPTSMKEIARIYNVAVTTVSTFVQRFKKRGYQLDKLNDRRYGKFKMLPQHVQDELVSPRLLNEWSCRSIIERQAIIKQKYNISIAHGTLESFYKSKGIRFK